MQTNLFPGDDLEGLVERAKTARQHTEGIGDLEHPPLAVVHAAGNDLLSQAAMTMLGAHEEIRDHADHLAPLCQHRIGDHAHEAD